jgi:hypothetical protein
MQSINVEGVIRFFGLYGSLDEDGGFVPDRDLVQYDRTLTAAQSAVFRAALGPCFEAWSADHGHELDPNYVPPEPDPVDPEEDYNNA